LLENGAKADAQNSGALWCASSNGHSEVFKFLLQNGAKADAIDSEALWKASSNGNKALQQRRAFAILLKA
jgi:hypothetical protein